MKTILLLCAMSFGAMGAAAADAGDAADAPVISNVSGYNDSVIASWPEKPRAIARAMFEKYGAPDTFSDRMLIWHDNGAWKRTIVYRDEVEHAFPVKHTDFLEQTVAYKVPLNKVGELAKFDGSVIVDRTRGELSARCDKEENNRLALNLADEISRGKRTVADARAFLVKTVASRMAGKSSDYMDKLSVAPSSSEEAADPDSDSIETE